MEFIKVCPRAFITASSDGSVALYFNYLNDEAQKQKFYEALKSAGVSFTDRIKPGEFADLYPKVDEVAPNCEKLIQAIRNFIEG